MYIHKLFILVYYEGLSKSNKGLSIFLCGN